MEKFFITTPIYYINAKPHIGHAYTTIAADTLARYRRSRGQKVLFSTGVDENSQKTVEAAWELKTEPKAYADNLAETWRQTWDKLEISYDDFIRTTDQRHLKAVEAFFGLIKKEDVYKGEYEGLYCVGHEAFLKEDELVDGKCPEHNRVPEKRQEENYFFKLSNYQQKLLTHIQEHPEFIQPESRRNEVVAFIKGGLEDLSISRQKTDWGIPFPGDPTQVLYVWFDALINYLTVTGFPDSPYQELWPADLHLMAKDIIRFHCVYWPAMLMSAGLPLPKTIFAHGFFTVDGQKIAKSLGNAVDPLDIVNSYGTEVLRYYLLREIPFGADGDFSHQRLLGIYNSELADSLGNLVQRTAAMIKQYQAGSLGEVGNSVHDAAPYHEAMDKLKLDKALAEVRELIRGLNQFIDGEKPWELAKSDAAQLQQVLAHAVADLRQIAVLLEPFMPQTAAKIGQIFKGPAVDTSVGILFPKREEQLKRTAF